MACLDLKKRKRVCIVLRVDGGKGALTCQKIRFATPPSVETVEHGM